MDAYEEWKAESLKKRPFIANSRRLLIKAIEDAGVEDFMNQLCYRAKSDMIYYGFSEDSYDWTVDAACWMMAKLGTVWERIQ